MVDILQINLSDRKGFLYGLTVEIDTNISAEYTNYKIIGQHTTRKMISELIEGNEYPLEKIGREILAKAINYGGGKLEVVINPVTK